MKYITLDVETGGIGDDKSLLSVYFGVYDSNLNFVDELDFYIKPNDGIYVLTAEALNINKIDIVKHDTIAVTEKEAGSRLYTFLLHYSDKGADKLIPVGHRVEFDINFVCKKLVSKGTWEQFVSYRCLDTSVLAQFLKLCGKIPDTVKGSLGSLAEFYKIEYKNAHTAKDDAQVTMKVVDAMFRSI